MTGTGTQADPYIVDTWPDFVAAVGTTGAYVEVVPGTVWDMNEIAPLGAGTVSINCAEINGNGAVIKAANITSDLLQFGHSCTVRRLNILDFDGKAIVMRVSGGATATLKKCSVTGIFNAVHSSIFYSDSGQIVFTADEPEYPGEKELGSMIDIISNNGSGICGAYYAGTALSLRYTNLHYVGDFNGSAYRHGVSVSDSLITGELNNAEFVSIRRTEINASGTLSSSSAVQTLVNSSKATIASGDFTAVTPEQMTDPVYLQSIGFPIGVVVNGV